VKVGFGEMGERRELGLGESWFEDGDGERVL
jgi:hypothetical protein